MLLFVQLVFGLAVVLAPGALVARALGVRRVSAAVAWALVVLFGALAVTFLVSASLDLTLALVLATGVASVPLVVRRRGTAPMSNRVERFLRGRRAVFAGGAVLGFLLWHVAGNLGGDAFFHLARVQKLLAFGDLSVQSVNEFPDGGLHPGYAFPLWHGFLALVAKVSGADPVDVVLHAPTVLAPLAAVLGYEAGWALFRRVAPAVTTAAAGIALVAMAPSHGGAFTALALPATASRQLLLPAALALAVEAARTPTRALLASAAAASLALAVVHPTYALFLWIPFTGFLLVRRLWGHREARAGALALAALVVPAAAFFAWLLPVVGDTASVDPDPAERTRAFAQYAGQLAGDADRFRVVPDLFSRTGAVAVAALLLLPLAGLASRRRWAAYAAGGALAVLVVCLVPWIFTPFSDAVSLSQSRRLAGFLPLAVALASGLRLVPPNVRGLKPGSPSPARRPNPLSPGLIAAVRAKVPAGAVVYADPEASYRIGAFAPVRICVAPPGHVADTVENRPRARVDEFRRFARTGNIVIPHACGATWLVVDRDRFPQISPDLPVVQRDERWLLYRLV
jgi:hypothetical protein